MRQYTRQTIKRNFFVAMLLAPFIPVLLALGTGGYLFWNHVQQSVLDKLTLLSAHNARVVDRFLDGFLGDLAMARAQLADCSDSPELRSAFETLAVKQVTDVPLANMIQLDIDGQSLSLGLQKV